VPLYAEFFVVNNLAYFLLWTFMALGLSLIWGHAGILSFGQTAFFGLAGYGYGVISINLGDAHGLTWVAVAGALIRLFDAWKRGRLKRISAPPERIAIYDRKRQAGILAGIFEESLRAFKR
jgi:ABC-type branched-subunit amino acid transport system permease subunit